MKHTETIDLSVLVACGLFKAPSVRTENRVRLFEIYLTQCFEVKLTYLPVDSDGKTLVDLYREYISLTQEKVMQYDRLVKRIELDLGEAVYYDLLMHSRLLVRTSTMISRNHKDVPIDNLEIISLYNGPS